MKISIKGTIIQSGLEDIYEWFGIIVTSPRMVEKILNALNGEDVDVEINSPGGEVFAGSEIYTLLMSYPGKVNVKVFGLAASAASVIAMAGDTVSMSPTAQIMIHNAWAVASGDYRDLNHTSDVLKNLNQSMANAYKLKTGIDEKELLGMMDAETWLTAQQAVDKGFADGIMFEQTQIAAAGSTAQLLPLDVINRVKGLLCEQEKINLLKIRRVSE